MADGLILATGSLALRRVVMRQNYVAAHARNRCQIMAVLVAVVPLLKLNHVAYPRVQVSNIRCIA